MKISELDKYYRNALAPHFGEPEARCVTSLLLERFYNIERETLIFNPQTEIYVDMSHVESHIKHLKEDFPVQYLTGQQQFYGRQFNVAQGVLIPRPETEELVDMIIKDYKNCSHIDILDIGTGSGAIAVTLAAEMPESRVAAFDISPAALRIAQSNATEVGVSVIFKLCDILHESISREAFDVIVSNPPYITPCEKPLMRSNVLDYEPSLALFVPQDDPLLFYRRIAVLGRESLRCGGRLYYEINERFGGETIEMLSALGYSQIELFRDLNGKDRMIKAVK